MNDSDVDGFSDDGAALILDTLFSLTNQHLLASYSCAVVASILIHGRLYVTRECVAFYSNIFGMETRRILPFADILEVRKGTVALVIPTLEFVVTDGCNGGGWGGERRDFPIFLRAHVARRGLRLLPGSSRWLSFCDWRRR